jgi:hypothetical protein
MKLVSNIIKYSICVLSFILWELTFVSLIRIREDLLYIIHINQDFRVVHSHYKVIHGQAFKTKSQTVPHPLLPNTNLELYAYPNRRSVINKVSVKIKLSLWLIKHRDMKTSAFNLGTAWRWLAEFSFRALQFTPGRRTDPTIPTS